MLNTNTISSYPFSNVEMIMIGPKDSSLARNMLSSTLVKMVGSIKKPLLNKIKCKIIVAMWWIIAHSLISEPQKENNYMF